MALATFPSGCWFLTLLFCVLAIFIDSLLIQSGTINTKTYYIIWKTTQLRLISVSDSDSVTNSTFINGQETAVSQQILLNYYSYDDIYDQCCVDSDSDSSDSSTNRRVRTLLSKETTLTSDDCDILSKLILTSIITLWMTVASIAFVLITMFVWLIIKMKWCEKCSKGCLRKTLKTLCFISALTIAGTITCSYIGLLQNDGSSIVQAIVGNSYDTDLWQAGPSVIMLTMAFIISVITIIAGFFARTPSITFVTWRKTQSIGSYDDEDR